ncbi:MAG: hypothetical protein AUJ98_11210 [Bacteroidetes bacterium CG2_30_33_31]|nr:MAG: hypothetical protein AUJ98_11210 [Bacteroidetes bacterium CG2_30_33_31]
MRKFYLLFAFVGISLVSAAQHYYNAPPVTPSGNPGNLNSDYEAPLGNGLPGGWTDIQPSSHPAWTASQTIPFTFSFNGQTFTQIKASTTGLVTFTTNPAAPITNHNTIPNSSVPDNTICAWGLGYSGGFSNDKIYTKTFGTAPHRQYWVSYNSYNNQSLGNKCWTYWAIVLEETSNKIYVVDQMSSTKNGCSPLLTIGLQYSSSSALMVTGSPNIHPLSSTSSTTVDNRFYEFIPGVRPTYDLAVEYIQTNVFQTSSTPVEVHGFIKNYGSQAVTSYDINYTIDNAAVKTEHVSGANIPLGGDMWYFHDSIWMASGLGLHPLKVWADNINGHSDQNVYNDTMYKTMEVMGIFVPKVAVHEYFTSSNNIDCAGAMDTIRKVFLNHPGEYTLISYPMQTDPYTKPDCQARATLYGVDSLPNMIVNGINPMDPRFYNEIYYGDFKAPSYISVTPHLSRSGNTVTATAAILPFPDWTNPTNAMKIRVAIVELITTGNVGTNGETKFYSVFRKFLSDINGINQASFTPGLYVNISKSYTFNTGDVENMNNLGVVVFIQNDVTKEIYQSGFAQINTGIDNPQSTTQGIISFYPNPAKSFVQLNYFVQSPDNVSYKVYDVTGREVLTMNKAFNSYGLKSTIISTENLSNGVYFLRMKIGSQEYSKKLIVNK